MAEPAASPDPGSLIRSRQFIVLLALAAVVGLVVSFIAWGFLELVHGLQVGLFDDLPKELGYDDGAPLWWYFALLGIGGLGVAGAIVLLPGTGGHLPAYGLKTGTTEPIELPGVMLAAFATLGFGLVLGPEAPLIALGGGLGVLAIRLARRDAPDQLLAVVGAAGAFAALSMIFGSPLIAAVILIEATGLGGSRLPLVLVPGMLAAGIGSLVSIGMGSWTGLSTSDYALPALPLPDFARPDAVDFLWTIALAVAVAVVAFAIKRLALALAGVVNTRPFLLLPAAGLIVAALAVGFHEAADHGVDQVLFSGQDALGSLVADPGAWSLSALALLIVFKGLAYAVSLACFRGGPVFPGLFLGAAAGVMAAQLPGFATTPAVAVGMAAATASVLGLPLAAAVVATVLTAESGVGAAPLIIVGTVVAYVTTKMLSRPPAADAATDGLAGVPRLAPEKPCAAREPPGAGVNASSGDPGGHDGREPAYRYHAVLLLLLLLVVFEVLAPDDDWSRAVALALESAALLVAVATQRARSEIRRARAGVISAGGALLVIAVASGVLSPALSSLLTGLVTAAIPLALVGGLLRLVRSQGVTVPAVSGALAIYLLLGLLFASAIGFVSHVDDTPYFANGTDGAWGDRVYYSFTVMTTTGFGDYTAATPVGHALAVVEMLFGQIYLVTIIGILVGNLVRRQP